MTAFTTLYSVNVKVNSLCVKIMCERVEIVRPDNMHACMYFCVHVPTSPSLLSATQMSVFHMYVSSDHSVKQAGRERGEKGGLGDSHSRRHQSMGD